MLRRMTLDERTRRVEMALMAAGIRYDANETAVFSRQLEDIETRLFEVKYPEGHGVEAVPLLTSIDPGAAQYTYRAYDYTGQAMRAADYSEDAPRVDLQGFEVTHKLHSYRVAYGYSIQDLREAAKANLPLERQRADAARNVLMRQLDANIWLGDSESNVTGLANNANVSLVSVITGTWSTATAAQILADLQKLVSASLTASKGVEKPNAIAMPITSYEYLATKFIGDNVDKTVLELFKRANPHITQIIPTYRLETADAGGTGPRIVCYNNDREKVEALVPIEFEQFPPIARNMAFTIQCHARFGGVAVRYPGSMRYMDGV